MLAVPAQSPSSVRQVPPTSVGTVGDRPSVGDDTCRLPVEAQSRSCTVCLCPLHWVQAAAAIASAASKATIAETAPGLIVRTTSSAVVLGAGALCLLGLGWLRLGRRRGFGLRLQRRGLD